MTSSEMARHGDLDQYTPAQVAWIRASSSTYLVCTSTIKKWVSWGRKWSCQICGADISGPKQACLDHDHATGQARGVICRNCNLGLGYLDRASWLDKAIAYLNGHHARSRRSVREHVTDKGTVSLPAPVERRTCLARVMQGRLCSKQALPFLIEADVCHGHATIDQRRLHRQREQQWRLLAEGLFWSVQAMWSAAVPMAEEDANA